MSCKMAVVRSSDGYPGSNTTAEQAFVPRPGDDVTMPSTINIPVAGPTRERVEFKLVLWVHKFGFPNHPAVQLCFIHLQQSSRWIEPNRHHHPRLEDTIREKFAHSSHKHQFRDQPLETVQAGRYSLGDG